LTLSTETEADVALQEGRGVSGPIVMLPQTVTSDVPMVLLTLKIKRTSVLEAAERLHGLQPAVAQVFCSMPCSDRDVMV